MQKEKVDGYYPCSICDWNSPSNVVIRDKNGKETAYCPIHRVNEEDDKQGEKVEKARDKFKDDFKKAFTNLDETTIEDITTE